MENVNTVGNRSRAFGLSFAAGFASFAAQIIYLREILSLLPQNEIIISLYFTVYLIAGGMGAYILRRADYRRLFLWFGPLFFVSLVSLRPVLRMSVYVPGQLPPLSVFIFALLFIIPFSIISGGFFSSLSKAFGMPWFIYGGDAIGSFASSLLLYFFLLPKFSSYYSAFVVMVLVGAFLFVKKLKWQGVIFALMFIPLLLLEKPTWGKIFAPLKIVEVQESPYGKITLTSYRGIFTIWENGEKLYDYPPTPAEKLAFLSLVGAGYGEKDVRHFSVLLIGGGGRCLKYLKKMKHLEITYVEPNPVLASLARRIFGMEKVRIILTDGRKFVRDTAEGFNLVIIDLPPPSSSASARFYTVEFFRELRRVSPTVSLVLPGGSFYSDVDSRMLSSVYFSLKESFKVIKAVPGEELVLVASIRNFNLSPDNYREFLIHHNITPEQYYPVQFSFEVNPIEMEKFKDALVRVNLNSDSRPVSYIYSLIKWLRHYFPEFPLYKTSLRWVLIIAVLLVFILFMRKPSLYMGLISFSAFAYELLLFLLFQYQLGYIYLQISLLAGIVMLSLGLGSIVFRKRISSFALVILPALVLIFPRPPLLLFYVLFFLLGFFEGGAFAYLSGKTEASVLYLADLTGSAIAGLLLGILFIPLIGFAGCFVALFIILTGSAIGVMWL